MLDRPFSGAAPKKANLSSFMHSAQKNIVNRIEIFISRIKTVAEYVGQQITDAELLEIYIHDHHRFLSHCTLLKLKKRLADASQI